MLHISCILWCMLFIASYCKDWHCSVPVVGAAAAVNNNNKLNNENPWFWHKQLVAGFLGDRWKPTTALSALLERLTTYEVCLSVYLDTDVCDGLRSAKVNHLTNFKYSCGSTMDYLGAHLAYNYNEQNTHDPSNKKDKDKDGNKQQKNNFASLVSALRRRNGNTVLIIGDSMSGLHYNDMYMSAQRYGFKVETESIDNSRVDNLFYIPAATNTLGPTASLANSSSTSTSSRVLQVFRVSNPDGELHQLQATLNRTRLHPHTNRDGPILVIINFGLHQGSNDAQFYAQQLEKILLYLGDLSSKSRRSDGGSRYVVVFRESTAQHFPTDSGMFRSIKRNGDVFLEALKAYAAAPSKNPMLAAAGRAAEGVALMFTASDSSSSSSRSSNNATAAAPVMASGDDGISMSAVSGTSRCVPLNITQYYMQNWRNELLRTKIKELGLGLHVGIARVFDASFGRYDLHRAVRVPLNNDCTHFCIAPGLWEQAMHDIVEFLSSSDEVVSQ